MVEHALLRIGKHAFSWNYHIPYVWLLLFDIKLYKKGKFRSRIKDVEERLTSFGITIEKIEEMLAVLSGWNKEEWKNNRHKVILSTDYYEPPLPSEISEEELDPNFVLEFLEEDEGVYEVTQLYRILLTLPKEKRNSTVVLDVHDLIMSETFDDAEVYYSAARESLVNKIIAYNNLFSFIAIDESIERLVLKKIQTLNENDLITAVIVPLFSRMGYHKVQSVQHHGPNEFGQDIPLFYDINKFGQRIYYGAQVKAKNVHLNAKKKTGNAVSIANQLNVALSIPFRDDEDNTEKKIDNVMAITSGEIKDAARKFLQNEFANRRLTMIDGKVLSKSIIKYQLAPQVLSL